MNAGGAAVRHGLLLVDKPAGCTSHDLVAAARRALGQREVGHAGTLDPMATGLLVLLLGEATKLSPYLTAHDKSYTATVRFGIATESLDADGAVTATSDAPPPESAAIARALGALVGPQAQVPPSVSAIKQGGVALHERVRRGEVVAVPARDVVLHRAQLLAVRPNECDLAIDCSKGFYVRALARDLAEALGTLGHLVALRRVATGPFDVREAIDGTLVQRAAWQRDEPARAEVVAAVQPISAASRSMATVTVASDVALALSQGKPVASDRLDGAVLVLSPDDPLPVCIGQVRDGVLRSARGFHFRPTEPK